MTPDTLPSGLLPSLNEGPDLPLVRGRVPSGTAPVVAVAASPRHPSNAVLLLTRQRGAPAQVSRALPVPEPADEAQQWFRAVLPAAEQGRPLDYRLELVRSGQRLASLPPDGSWLTVTGAPSPDPPSPPGTPRWGYEFTFFAGLTVAGRLEVIGETPEGYRANFLAEGGRISGPGIEGVVRPGGGDWMCVRRDGVGSLDIRATCETVDGAVVFYRAGGVVDLGRDGYARIVAGELSGCPPFYATPIFRTEHRRWEWLNRLQGLGIGRVMIEEYRVEYDIYFPRAGNRLPGD